jgi:hypothetical protein
MTENGKTTPHGLMCRRPMRMRGTAVNVAPRHRWARHTSISGHIGVQYRVPTERFATCAAPGPLLVVTGATPSDQTRPGGHHDHIKLARDEGEDRKEKASLFVYMVRNQPSSIFSFRERGSSEICRGPRDAPVASQSNLSQPDPDE